MARTIPARRASVFALTAVLAGCSDLLSPAEKPLTVQIEGPTSVVAEKQTFPGYVDVSCRVSLKTRTVAGRQGEYAVWGDATIRFYDLPADTLMTNGTGKVSAAQVSYWLGADRIERGQVLNGSIGAGSGTGHLFRLEVDFTYQPMRSPDKPSSGAQKVRYSFRCE